MDVQSVTFQKANLSQLCYVYVCLCVCMWLLDVLNCAGNKIKSTWESDKLFFIDDVLIKM